MQEDDLFGSALFLWYNVNLVAYQSLKITFLPHGFLL